MSATESSALFSFHDSTYHAANKERVDIGYVAHARAEHVVDWLRSEYQPPEQGAYADMWREGEPRTLLEYILYRRNSRLIDYGLARYGRSEKILQRIYSRGGVAIRLAALTNPYGSMHLRQANDVLLGGGKNELKALFSNPHLGGRLFTNLFERKEGVFEQINDERFAFLIHHAVGHPRLVREYDSLLLDGYDDYTYHRTFSAAWELANTVPVTKQWASLLERLLGSCVAPVNFNDVEKALQRWQIDEPLKADAEWYDRGPAFGLRVVLASLIEKDEVLIGGDDAALRMTFYRRLDPRKHQSWTDFFEKDGAEFVHYALENDRLWQRNEERSALRTLCWRCPDKHSTMDYPNEYRAIEQRMRLKHPEWFREIEGQALKEPADDQMAQGLQDIKAGLQQLSQSVTQLFHRVGTNKGWWVATALFLYILVR